MPLKLFLKLYLRLIGLTTVVLLLCFSLFWGSNAVRLQAWHEHYPAPLMRWLATIPEPLVQYPWLAEFYDVHQLSPADLVAGSVTRERLGYGQVVAEATSLGWRVMLADSQGRVLEAHFRDTYKQVAEAIAYVSLFHLNETLPDERDTLMAQLSSALGVSLKPLISGSVPDTAVLEQVTQRHVALYRGEEADSSRVLIRLQDGTLLGMTFPSAFNPWHWSVILLLVLVAASVLAAALYLLLRGVDHNLRAVESVAVRIARGEMGARVEAGDSTLVSRLASAFNSMAEQIQRLVGVQREMIHAVSHELRTPVARIRFGVQMLEGGSSPEALQKQLDGIDGDIQELDELIDEILTYARLEQGGPVFSLVEASVTDIVRQVVGEQQLIRPDTAIEAEISDDCERWAMSDVEPRYIHRAIQNLVGNAARYASARVRVRCQLDEDNCRVDVEDDGAGIPEEDWEKVFTAFARLDDSRTRTSGGYGLGLSIVRRILYWHGGQAFVGRSEDLGGARFSLVWPRKAPLDGAL